MAIHPSFLKPLPYQTQPGVLAPIGLRYQEVSQFIPRDTKPVYCLIYGGKRCTITSMETVTMKVWKQTLYNLKIPAAYQGKTMLSILDSLVNEALVREEVKRKVRTNGE